MFFFSIFFFTRSVKPRVVYVTIIIINIIIAHVSTDIVIIIIIYTCARVWNRRYLTYTCAILSSCEKEIFRVFRAKAILAAALRRVVPRKQQIIFVNCVHTYIYIRRYTYTSDLVALGRLPTNENTRAPVSVILYINHHR